MDSIDAKRNAIGSILGQIRTGYLGIDSHLELSIVTDAIVEYAKNHNLMYC